MAKTDLLNINVYYQKLMAKKGIRRLLTIIRDSGMGSFLTVLKLMGPGRNESPLAFPIEGYTLALDFKIQKGLFKMLNQLDKVVLDYGGRFVPRKRCSYEP